MAARLGLDEIAALMRRYLEEDEGKKSLVVEGASLDEALRDAGIQLSTPLVRLEYEVLQRGNPGILGLGKTAWRLKVSVAAKKQEVELPRAAETPLGEEIEEIHVVRDEDGECFVRLSSEGALLKVKPPQGRGKRASERQAIDRLEARAVRHYDEDMVRELIRQASGEYARVGEFMSNPASDALLSVEITDQEMKAFVTLTPPGPGGCDLSKDTILAFLRNNRVVHGVLPEALQELEDRPRYRAPTLVAEGSKPQNGRDASVQFNFETDKTKLRLKEAEDGRVNFKELGLIQNVVAGQPLARKMPPENGEVGRTVTGKVIPARNGKDMPPPLGRNVHLADDGITIIADMNGQVTYIGGKINVEEMLTVQGDVSLKTGNVMFLGNVIVTGNVEDGFSVKASGNIEVRGNVGKCEVVAEGDIVIHQGINAKSGGLVQAGKNVWAKFVENAFVEAGENIVVSDGMVNTTAVAAKKIICQGKRASIVGGRYRACEEINVKNLGSPVGGAETVLEVGYDPKSKEKLDQLGTQIQKLKKQAESLDKDIATLNAAKKQKGSLPEDKEAVLQDFLGQRGELLGEISDLTKEAESIQAYLNGLKSRGRISASARIYPGVKICIKDIKEEIKTEQKAITFYLENQMIRTTKYEEPEDEFLKRGPPDVNKTN
jgi:uncharacterized protein (DUF342 family)